MKLRQMEQGCGCSTVRGGGGLNALNVRARLCLWHLIEYCLSQRSATCRMLSAIWFGGATTKLRLMEQGCGCSTVRGGGTCRWLVTAACTLYPSATAPETMQPQASLISRSSIWWLPLAKAINFWQTPAGGWSRRQALSTRVPAPLRRARTLKSTSILYHGAAVSLLDQSEIPGVSGAIQYGRRYLFVSKQLTRHTGCSRLPPKSVNKLARLVGYQETREANEEQPQACLSVGRIPDGSRGAKQTMVDGGFSLVGNPQSECRQDLVFMPS